MTDKELKVLELIFEFGGIDGGHHKQWLLDSIVRELAGDSYEQWVAKWNNGEDGPDTYSWDKGIAP